MLCMLAPATNSITELPKLDVHASLLYFTVLLVSSGVVQSSVAWFVSGLVLGESWLNTTSPLHEIKQLGNSVKPSAIF